jgi:ATP synthase protein I
MADHNDPPTLEDINARLKATQEAGAEKQKAGFRQHETSRGMGLGMRIGIELVVAVLAGGGMGLFIDSKLKTKPVFMLAFLALGFAAGVLNVLRLSRRMDEAVGFGRAAREKEAADKAAGETDETKTTAPE